jgi:hypothetical protein
MSNKQEFREPEWEQLPSGVWRMEVFVDDDDHRDICRATSLRSNHMLPDATHDDASLQGRLIAEVCRGWLKMIGK